jgi:hypothetical protein
LTSHLLKMNRLLIIIFSICSLSAFCGNSLKKGFTALKIYDYFLAKKCFYKSLDKDPAAAAYGLSTIYLRNDNPFHNYDSAYKYCMLSRFSYAAMKPEEIKKLAKFGVTDSLIVQLCDSVFNGAHEYYVTKALRNNTSSDSILNRYIDYYFFSSYREEALKLRDNVIFSDTKKNYKSEEFRNYISTWPESYYLQDAFYFLEKTIYEENTTGKSVAEFLKFIGKEPKNRFIKNAEDEIFFIHRKKRDKEGLITFIRAFPKNEHVTEAWKLFFTLTVDKYTPDNLAEFVLDYPEFPLRKTIIAEINLLNKKLLRIKTADKFGYVDTTGSIVIPPTFEEAENFSEGLAIASKDEKYGYIDKNGNWAVQPVYDECEPFHDGVAIVRANKKSLVIDRTGVVISDDFDEINDFNEGLAVVKKNGTYGAVNRLGNTIIPIECEKLGDFKEGHAWFQKDGKYGILDKQNFVSINNDYEWVDDYADFIRAKKNGAYGVITRLGDLVIPFEYERIENYKDIIFIVVKQGKYGFADKTGCLYTKLEFDFDPKLKAADLVYVANKNSVWMDFKLIKDGSQALMNQNGKLLADFDEYEEVYLPSSDLVRVMNNDKYNFLDMKMHPAFKGNFDEAEDFINGFCIVIKKEKYTIIDRTGAPVFTEPCDEIERIEENFFIVTRGGLKGLLDQKLKWILQPEYQEIEKTEDDYFELKKDGKRIVYSLQQNKIIWSE